jgi:hypothetical protein
MNGESDHPPLVLMPSFVGIAVSVVVAESTTALSAMGSVPFVVSALVQFESARKSATERCIVHSVREIRGLSPR